ncbi:t-SNARE [Conidiobolus coronatus NRRL 28638]|uniref:t-SNARE n=1 Tax=Conidiobolus coronatus (strain ATCC 28846 / CBS 209.66 / NRRL 28638) TaxID=796925 RepID=A0A137P548_CONC2|nr:t-SNARE [Conidiobolus coronatus NRRL 28638]|eukprot:KXN70142.1 t-SNARE [Conidiobolus coronatus NRRL 28638]
MSFNDLEQGFGTNNNFGSDMAALDESQILPKEITKLIYRITTNVNTMQRLVTHFGTLKDNQNVRKQLHDLTERTRLVVKETTHQIKMLTIETDNLSPNQLRQRKLDQQKLSKDFSKALEQFQHVQRVSAEKSREVVDILHRHQTQDLENSEIQEDWDTSTVWVEGDKRGQLERLDDDIQFNESMIHEREREIREIESGITELNEIFRDLGTFVNEQQHLLDNVETNVSNIATNTNSATSELRQANDYQKRAKNSLCFIFIILAVIVVVFVLVLFG